MDERISFVVATPEQIDSLGGASDGGLLIYDGAVLLGWSDDYGTVTHPDHDIAPDIKLAAENAVEAINKLMVEIMIPEVNSHVTVLEQVKDG